MTPAHPWFGHTGRFVALCCLLAVSTMSLACQPGALETIDVAQSGDAVIVVVTLDDTGRPLRILPPFGVLDGALDFGARPQFELRGEELSAAWLRLPKDVLDASYPGAWAHRRTLAVEGQPPPPTPQSLVVLDGTAWEWTTALPFDIEVVGAAAQTLREALTLRLVQEGEPCAVRRRAPLVPFAATPRPLPRSTTQSLDGMVVLDAETVIVGGRDIVVLRRGQPVNGSEPGQMLARGDYFEGEDSSGVQVEDLRLDPRTADLPNKRLYALVSKSFLSGSIVELSYEQGSLSFVRTATTTTLYLRTLDVSEAGRIAASGDGGHVIISDDGGQSFVRKDLPGSGPSGFKVRKALFTSDPQVPLLMANVDRVFSLDAQGLSWIPHQALPIDTRVLFAGMDTDGRQIWLGGHRGVLAHGSLSEGFNEVKARFSPRAGDCTEPDGVQPRWNMRQNVSTLALADGGALVAYEYCGAIFHIDAATGCVTTTRNPEGPAVSSPAIYNEMVLYEDQVILSDTRGGIFISEGFEAQP